MEQVLDHLAAGDHSSPKERGEVERRRNRVRKTERQHRGDPALSELQRPASRLGHHVLLHNTTGEVVHRTRRVLLALKVPGLVGVLRTRQDVEVVVRRVTASVALGAKRRAKEDQVFGDGSVDDVHGTHRTTSVVKDPLGRLAERVSVEGRGHLGVLAQLLHNVVKDLIGILAVLRNRLLGDAVQLLLVKNVELLLGEKKNVPCARPGR